MAGSIEAQISEVASTLRSCLLTSKNGCPIDALNRDYKMLEGRYIPYQKLGFPSLDAFMKVVPNIRMIRRGSELWVEAVPTKESAHISRLVANQNQPKQRRRRPQRFVNPPPARRPPPVSLYRGSRGPDLAQSRNRSSNTASQNSRVTSSSNPTTPTMPVTVTVYSPKPLMQQIVTPPPLMSLPLVSSSPTKPRFAMTNAAAVTSPSKRMFERNIQPQQHLDYEKKHREAAAKPVTVYSPKKSKPIIEPLRMPIRPQQAAVMTPTTPISSGPMDMWTPGAMGLNPAESGPVTHELLTPPQTPLLGQTVAKSRISDRLKIQPPPTMQFNNSTVVNGNGSIQVTFNNTNGGGSDCPTDPREELEMFVRSLNLPAPEYKDVPVHGKHGTEARFYGQVLIGLQKFSSYPEEAKTEAEAETLAARRALVDLKKEVVAKFRLSSTTDRGLMKQRILAIVDQHNGVFIHKIPAYYEEQHNEKLPDSWEEEVKNWVAEVTMDVGVNESKILRRVSFTGIDKKIEKPVVGPAKPPQLELPEEHHWSAYVELVHSTTEIWIRPVGEAYSDEFQQMTVDMYKHYTSTRYPTSYVAVVDDYYVLQDDEYCHRVRVLEFDETSCEATIFFIDIGFEDTVSASKLLPLDRKFCSLSAQAMKVSLAGLEEFDEYTNTIDMVLPRIEKLLLDGVFAVEDVTRGTDGERPVASIIFWDTNGQSDVNVNNLIWKKIHQQLDTIVPRLEDEQPITEINVSHVEPNGDVFIQVKHEGMKYLVNMMNKLISNSLNDEDIRRSVIQNTVDRMSVYLVKCSTSGDWYRAKVIDDATDETGTPLLKVFLIDFGRMINVSPSNVLQLEILSKTLARYPSQAMKVRLHDIEPALIDEKMIARFTELAPPSQMLLLKVGKPSYRGSTPTVHLYKRNKADNMLSHINAALILEYELSKANGDGNNNVNKPKKRVDRVNSRTNGEAEETIKTLKPPRISAIGQYFDVRVTMAANPSNFTVQPQKNYVQLQTMMAKLQDNCLGYTGPHTSLESIKEGKLFAAQHTDDIWYRVSISNIINNHMVTVYFCDYGDVTVISLDKLRPLADEFFELPYQAIKARLAGVQPKNYDWSPEDCVRFQELIVERIFVSVINESVPDKHSPRDMVLGLTLIDVSTPDDVYIAEVLVKEGRATFVG